MKRKSLALLLVLTLLVSLFLPACSGSGSSGEETPAAEQSESSQAASESAPASSTSSEETGTAPAAQEGFPLTEEKVEFTVFFIPHVAVTDMSENYATKWFEEKTNVHINWNITTQEDYATKLTLVMSNANDMPDIFLCSNMNRAQADAYGAQGLLIPLQDYIENSSVNYKRIVENNPSVLQQSLSYDGNIYFLSQYYETIHILHSQKQWINQKWLDNLGLEMPTTTDEYYKVLKAFKEEDANGNGDPNDEIPYIGTKNGWNGQIRYFLMNSFVYSPPTLTTFYLENGGMTAAFAQEGWREGLRFYKKLYDEKLLDPEALTITTDQVRALSSDPGGNRIGSFPGGIATENVDTTSADIFDYVTVPPLEGPSGLRQAPLENFVPQPTFMITAKCEEPEIAFRWADAMCVDVVSEVESGNYDMLNFWYGPEDDPQGWSRAAEGETGFTGKPAYFKWNFNWSDPLNTHWYEKFVINMRSPWKEMMTAEVVEGVYDQERVLYEETSEKYRPYSVDKTMPAISLEADLSAEYANILSTLETYVNESFAKVLTGEWSLDSDWEAYLAEMDKIGLPRALEIAQTAYDKTQQ
ncbi:MAG: extracellular solute-binding protein [Oscillospiraceae bacterium]